MRSFVAALLPSCVRASRIRQPKYLRLQVNFWLGHVPRGDKDRWDLLVQEAFPF